jgi:hypothetical protein
VDKLILVAVFKFVKFFELSKPNVYKFKANGLGIRPGSVVRGDI